MWIRKRLDISQRDLFYAIYSCLIPGSRNSLNRKIENIWGKNGQKILICLSVRTGFDLLFQALNFEPGSEILMSALTIPDMATIVVHHKLVPVPVDIDIDNLAPEAQRIEAAITSRTKAIVIAHLFGGISDLKRISELAKKHDLFVIEDCAQAYYSCSFTGSPAADISMFSFGTIKTSTAFGGGILIFRNNNLPIAEIHKLQHSYPTQNRSKFLMKTLKYFFIILMTSPKIFPVVIKFLEQRGIDYDKYIHQISRSFPKGDLFANIRKQPSLPLLKLMLHRFRTYDFSNISKRMELGDFIVDNLSGSFIFPGKKSIVQTYWAFPVLTSDPAKLLPVLKKAGFDATHHSSLQVVGFSGTQTVTGLQTSHSILDRIVYLPFYPEMPRSEIDKMISILKTSEKSGIVNHQTSEYNAVKSFLESQVDVTILPGYNLMSDIPLDSLGKLSLISFIENSFGIKFDEKKLGKFASVRELADYIQNNKQFHKTDLISTWEEDLKNDSDVILPNATFLRDFVLNFSRRLLRFCFRFEGTGIENIPEGPCLIAPNHESFIDPFLVLYFLANESIRKTVLYAKKNHFRSAIRRYLAGHVNVIIMDLSKDLKISILKMAKAVKQGKTVLIFPEGTRTRTGETGEFRKTYSILSIELKVPVVPVAITGAFTAMSSGARKDKTKEKINIRFLPAVYPGEMNPEEMNELVKQKIITAINER